LGETRSRKPREEQVGDDPDQQLGHPHSSAPAMPASAAASVQMP
jgi:hypothetical protein